jgi:hypothetical protein
MPSNLLSYFNHPLPCFLMLALPALEQFVIVLLARLLA